MTLRWIEPDWPAPPGIRSASTCRTGGVSSGPFDSLNLGTHVGDDLECVNQNRLLLRTGLDLPSSPQWLNQCHGNRVIVAGCGGTPEADAAFTREPGIVCAVMTADCLPILLCTQDGSAIAAVHAGWKGLAGGVVEATLQELGNAQPILAWLGPAIGPDAFEVGDDVMNVFTGISSHYTAAFRPTGSGKFMANIYQLGRTALELSGLKSEAIYGGGWCTYHQPDAFFSYRRDRITGRMATLIWR